MATKKNDTEIVWAMRQRLRLERDRQIQMRSRTFWEDRIGIERRTQSRVRSIRDILAGDGIKVSLNGSFGTEPANEWLTFTLIDVEPWPDDAWFDEMATKVLKTEAEVEAFFIHPLLRHLGYRERDLALQHGIVVNDGAKPRKFEAYLVVFDDRVEDDDIVEGLLVGEAKRQDTQLVEAHSRQARSYAQWLNAPLYLLTNGNESHLYYNPPSVRPKLILTFQRDELSERWPDLVEFLSKESVVALKERIRERLRDVI